MNAREQLDGEERVTAKIEKIVVHTHVGNGQQVAPNRGQLLFERSPGRSRNSARQSSPFLPPERNRGGNLRRRLIIARNAFVIEAPNDSSGNLRRDGGRRRGIG